MTCSKSPFHLTIDDGRKQYGSSGGSPDNLLEFTSRQNEGSCRDNLTFHSFSMTCSESPFHLTIDDGRFEELCWSDSGRETAAATERNVVCRSSVTTMMHRSLRKITHIHLNTCSHATHPIFLYSYLLLAIVSYSYLTMRLSDILSRGLSRTHPLLLRPSY